MGQPTGSDLHVNRPLTNISIAYIQDQTDFAASRAFPPVPVDHKSDEYYVYNKGDWFRTQSKSRAPRTESAGGGWNMSTDSYKADVKAFHVDVDDQTRADQDSPVINLDRDATTFVTRDMWLRRELDWVEAYFGAGKWGTTDQTGAAAAGSNQFVQWSRSSSKPIEDVTHQRLLMAQKTGLRPNVGVMGAWVYEILKDHPEFLERIKYTQKGVVTLDLMASLWDLDEVLVPMAVQNTAEEAADGSDTPIMDFIYGKGMLLAYRPASAGLMVPSAGYTFEWTGYLGAAERGTRMKKFRMEALAADRVEIESAYVFKQVSSDLGVYFDQCVQ